MSPYVIIVEFTVKSGGMARFMPLILENAEVSLREEDHPYVSRGGLKLAGALDEFARGTAEHAGLQVTGRVALDIGASTGGFTDCLLQRGVARVHNPE